MQRALFAYAWDVLEAGTDAIGREFAALGLDTVTLAGAYHAGKFIRPHGRDGKVYFPEDGTIYFHADPSRYGNIKPEANSLLEAADPFEALCRNGALTVNAWLVLMHNTLLGQRHPECTVQNAFGDRYVYSLCPAAPDVRAYALALCGDITERYPVTGISLESPGFLPYAHGYHHEFALIRQNVWLDNLLGLCFCRHCVDGASQAGVDMPALQARVQTQIESYLASDCDFEDDMATAIWQADLAGDVDLHGLMQWRCEVVTSLIAEIREAVRSDASIAVIPSVARPSAGCWYEGSALGDLGRAAGMLEVCFYESGPARIRDDLWDVRRRIDPGTKLKGVLRPGHPDLNSAGEVAAAVRLLAEAGLDGISFYNYGHLRPASLRWMADALTALDGAP